MRLGLYRCWCTEVADIVPPKCPEHAERLATEVDVREPVVVGHECGELMSPADALAWTLAKDPEPLPDEELIAAHRAAEKPTPTYEPAPRMREAESDEHQEAS